MSSLHPKTLLKRGLERLGFELKSKRGKCPPDFDPWMREIYDAVSPYTMTSAERIGSLCNAVDYVSRNNIPGAIVECGVWRGGSVMAALLRLVQLGDTARDVYLYDTYSGMTSPTDRDVSMFGEAAESMMERNAEDETVVCLAPLDDVKKNVATTGYPMDRVRFIEGPVEETLRTTIPESISLLRLDTDWYASTKVELEVLFPRLAVGGVLIIDDYGYWEGARGAVDEFIAGGSRRLLLNRIDETGRIAIKLEA